MNTDIAHEFQFLCEKSKGVKNINIPYCQLESVLLVLFSPTSPFIFLKKIERQKKVMQFIQYRK